MHKLIKWVVVGTIGAVAVGAAGIWATKNNTKVTGAIESGKAMLTSVCTKIKARFAGSVEEPVVVSEGAEHKVV